MTPPPTTENVVLTSKNQRYPLPNEPICVICQRYGEYICDLTNEDVCSVECRNVCIERSPNSINRANLNNTSYEILSKNPIQEFFMKTSICKLCGKIFAKLINLKGEFENTCSAECNKKYTKNTKTLDTTSYRQKLDILRKELNIVVEGENIPDLLLNFNHDNIPVQLQQNLTQKAYEFPTPIQMQAIPIALKGFDMVICSPTGTGKTASFLIPVLCKVIEKRTHETLYPIAIVIAPTRELIFQLEDQTKILIYGIPDMKTALLVGGLPLPPQVYRINCGIQLIFATTGRLLEILNNKESLCIDYVECFVIDEVDLMLSMGFEEDVRLLKEYLPDNLQTILCSATIPYRIREMAKKLLKPNAFYIHVGNIGNMDSCVSQKLLWVEENDKKQKLFSIIRNPNEYCPPLIVFVESKTGADLLAKSIMEKCGVSTESLHGGKSQKERLTLLKQFMDGEYDVLVATSLLGRGLDLLPVKLVVNFDMPQRIEEYIHQIGRASRLGEVGSSITFINRSNKGSFDRLHKLLQQYRVIMPREMIDLVKCKVYRPQKRKAMNSSSALQSFTEQGDVSWEEWKNLNLKRLK